MTQVVSVHTDGACKGNPGPGGWGFILQVAGAEKELFGGEHNTTNNRMELMAAIKALQALSRPCNVELYTDSQYVIKGCEEWLSGWKKRGWKTSTKEPVKNEDLWRLLDAELGRHDVLFHWIKGHSGHPMNERADKLANLGVASLGKAPPQTSGQAKPPTGAKAQASLNFRPAINSKPMIKVHTDGSVRKSLAGGWGLIMIEDGIETELSGWSLDTTNNRMEMAGPIRALEIATPDHPLHITTDSQYVQKGIEEWIEDWKRRGWRTAANKPVKNIDLWMRLDALCQERHVTWAWVKGHSGDHYNERADKLAGDASLYAQEHGARELGMASQA